METLFYGALILGGVVVLLLIAFAVVMWFLFPGTPTQ
jgi:hypothetical protein